ncbi:hydroxyacid oxidase 1-like [Anneissia japonica]|uniref:hydroxyacid oxidase 1-like n=1 Tax=Anneissia japonica TaxID=1529436 RepID=UPI001425527F|nr:hydroxyacid oxidase 1-like [Anneissia japonica]
MANKRREKCYSIFDYEKQASEKLSEVARGFFDGGSDRKETSRNNVVAFSRYKLRPRHMRDVSSIDMRQNVLGCDIEFPIIVAPMAHQKMAHRDGENATASACADMGTVFTFAPWTTTTMEELMSNSRTGTKWLQLYISKDRTIIADIVHKAERNGFRAILATIDIKVLPNRLDDKINQFEFPVPEHFRSYNYENVSFINSSLSWEDIDWLKSITSLPVAVKGVMTREDAVEAVQHGVDGIVVSNHGGRALDGVQASIDALSEVIEAVKHTGIDILVDGGIRMGTDVLKALSLGAKAVLIGRPAIWGLAHDGENGVKSVLSILKDELRTSMGLAGCPSLADINQSLIILPKSSL